MDNANKQPVTLLDAIKHFSDPENCRKSMAAILRPGAEPVCPHLQVSRRGSVQIQHSPAHRRRAIHYGTETGIRPQVDLWQADRRGAGSTTNQ
jgi:hypothetical protein